MLVVLAETRFDASQTDRARSVARPMIEASRAEPGCAGYDYAFDLLEPDLMRVRELWRDEPALKDRFATPHMAAFLKGLRELRPVGHREVLRARARAEDAERVIVFWTAGLWPAS